MTFPATSPLLVPVVEARGLIPIGSETNSRGGVRQLWVTQEAGELLDGRSDAYFPVERFALLVERYLNGYLVRVSIEGDPLSRLPDFELLLTEDEVWVFCSRSPKSHQYRFFGRFTAQGEFVILFGRSRKSLENGGYAAAIQEFKDQWFALFGNHDCLKATTVDEYLGGVARNVYEEE